MNRAAAAAAGVASLVLLVAGDAVAIPVFARKYGTSCMTCHTVYPKLTPFGEGFRRNGFRFPGVDSDYWKQETVPLTPKEAGSEPASLPAIPAIALGFNGQATFHPDKSSSGGAADNQTNFSLRDLIAEAHAWTGGSIDEHITWFGEVTFSSDGTVDVEHGQLFYNDLIGPKHAVNLRVGRGFATTSTFGVHSSYLADTRGVSLAVTALNGGSPSWNLLDHYNGIEVTGVLGGRLDYAIGLNAGSNAGAVGLRPTEDAYAHLGYKIGGLRLDAEGKGNGDPTRPWEETALTFEIFAYRAFSSSIFSTTDSSGAPASITNWDRTHAIGGGLRGQVGSLELNAGLYYEDHSHANPDGTGATALANYEELSYMVNAWLVPAIRFEYFSLTNSGQSAVSLYRILPGLAVNVRPNIKVTLVAAIEGASGAPPGGWGAVNGSAAPADNTKSIGPELESVSVGLAFAF